LIIRQIAIGIEVMIDTTVVENNVAGGAYGAHTVREILPHRLRDSGLTHRKNGSVLQVTPVLPVAPHTSFVKLNEHDGSSTLCLS